MNNMEKEIRIPRDHSHEEQIERWARFVRDNPNDWKKPHKLFIDSQIIMSRRFYNNLSKSQGGKIKLQLLRNTIYFKKTSKHF